MTKCALILLVYIALFLILLAACVECQAQEPARPHDRWQVPLELTFAGLQAADAGLTETGYRTVPNWQEHNPIVPGSTTGRMAYFGASGASVLVLERLCLRNGHHRRGLALLLGAIAVEAIAVQHTARGLSR